MRKVQDCWEPIEWAKLQVEGHRAYAIQRTPFAASCHFAIPASLVRLHPDKKIEHHIEVEEFLLLLEIEF